LPLIPGAAILDFMNEVTRFLSAIEQGDPNAAAELLPLVYDELRWLAAQKMGQEKPDQTLQATALVHEAYLRLVDVKDQQNWDNRRHFFAAAAEAMRRILVENARRRASGKHGGKLTRLALNPDQIAHPDRADELLALDEALERLQSADPTVAALVRLRYFAGMTIPQAAAALGVATRTANSYWSYAKAWLSAELEK
jgi:RNA polymerase sigma factor (TIGR02999 family)